MPTLTSQNRIAINIIANYMGRGLSVLLLYVSLPVYVHKLGPERYGIIAFYTILQAVVSLTDLGLSGALTRQLAGLSSSPGTAREMRDFVRTVESVYMFIVLAVVICVAAGAGLIARHWLNIGSLGLDMVSHVVMLMGAGLSFQLTGSLYLAGLVGLQHQVLSNGILSLYGLLRAVFGLSVVWGGSKSLYSFFISQVVASVFFMIFARYALWRSLPSAQAPARVRPALLVGIAPYALGVFAIGINAIILTQIDKILVSKLLSLDTFAYYSLAATIAQVPVVLSNTIANAVFPRLAQLFAGAYSEQLALEYQRVSKLVSVLALPAGVVIATFASDLLFLWTRSGLIAENAALTCSFLVIGSTLLALQVLPYNLALAAGYTKLNVTVGWSGVVISLPLTTFLIKSWGAPGGAFGWLVLNVLVTPFIILRIHSKLMKGGTGVWLRDSFGKPFLASLVSVLAVRVVVTDQPSATGAFCRVAVATVAAVLLSSLMTFGARWQRIFGVVHDQT